MQPGTRQPSLRSILRTASIQLRRTKGTVHRYSGPVATSGLTVVLVLVGAACANAPTRASPTGSSARSVAQVACEADGSTRLVTPEVQVRPDGFTLRVISDLNEPASINGLGTDVDPGVTESEATTPPGRLEVACWPFSEHGSQEPPTQTLTISDPEGLYVSAELQCPPGEDERWSEILDFPDTQHGVYTSPTEAASAHLRRLEPTDELRQAGYPEQQDAPVIVVRDGAVVASVSVRLAKDGRWYVAGASGCSSIQ